MPVTPDNSFDPSKYGATEVSDTPAFDPSKYGAVEVKKKDGKILSVGADGQLKQSSQSVSELHSPKASDFGMVDPRQIALGQQSKSDKNDLSGMQQSLMSAEEKVHHEERAKARAEKTEEAITNTATNSLKLKGIKPTAIQLNREKDKYRAQLKLGFASLASNREGKPGLKRVTGVLENLAKGWNEAVKSSDEDRQFVTEMSPEQQVEYLNKNPELIKENEYIGEFPSTSGGVAEFVGGSAPLLGKAAVGTAIGAGLVAAAPETMGASLAGLPVAMAALLTTPEMAYRGAKEEIVRRFQSLKKQNPQAKDIDLIKEANHGAIAGGIGGAVTNAILMGTGSGISKASKDLLGGTIKHILKSSAEIGGASGAVTAAVQEEANLEGVKTPQSEIWKNTVKSVKDNATTGLLLTSMIHGVPKLFSSTIKYVLAKDSSPVEVSEILEANNVPKETADKIVNDISEYKQALEKSPSGLSPESEASISGLIQKRTNIEKEAETKDKSAAIQDVYKEQTEAINRQISEIQRTGKPLEHEINEASGDTYKQPTYDEVQKQRVEDLAEKISKGKRIEDAEDLQTQVNFPDELEKQLNRIAKEEKSGNKDKENPNTELSDNIDKYLKSNEKETAKISDTKEETGITDERVSKNSQPTEESKGASVIMPEDNTKPNIIELKKPENAIPEQSTNEMDVRQQTENGSTVGSGNEESKTGTGEENKGNVEGEKEGVGITHAQTEEIANEHGFAAYEKDPRTIAEWDEKAQDRLRDGCMPDLIKKMEGGNEISPVEQRMMGFHIANLDAEVRKNPTNENISALKHAVELSDVVGGRQAGQSLVARKGAFLPDDSLGASLINEMESLGVKELPESVKEKVINEHDELTKAREELSKANQEVAILQLEAKAKAEIAKTVKNSKNNKYKRDFSAEKQSLKDKLKQQILDYKTAINKVGISSDGGIESFVISAEMAKTIGQYVKVNVEEGISKLEEVVNKVYDDIKDLGVSKKQIVDVIGGVYDEKKSSRVSLASELRDLRTEAKLLKKLEDTRMGKDAANEKSKTVKSRRVSELENKIKEVRKRRKDENPIEENGEGKLAEKRKRILKKIESIQKDIKDGVFEKEEKPHPIRLDKHTQALQDRVIQLESQQAVRRAKNEYDKQGWLTKAMDTFWQVTGLRRLIGAAVDFSIPFRQTNTIVLNPFKYRTTLKSFANMFDKAFSPDKFKRFQYNLEKSEMGRMFTHFNGVLSNPTEVKMEKREEEFTNNMFSRIHQKIESGNNETLKKVSKVADKVWFSERAAAAFLNTARVEEFSNGVKALQNQGLTPENAPKEYKDLAKWVMDMTGRGNMIKALEDSHAGRIIANRAYFGARLMAAKINMLNPITYAKLSPEVRVQAIRDMVGYTSGLAMAGLAGMAAGGTVSFNPNDPDFMQLRFGDKVYDLSGGSVAYVRTFLRFLEGVKAQIQSPGSRSANSATGFAGRSIWKSMVANKLSPNTAYLYHAWTGKGAAYDENGKQESFDPLEIAKIYPLYVDGTMQAFKKGGVTDALAMLIPDLFGVGTQQYNKKGGSGGGGGATGKEPEPKEHKEPEMPTP